MKTKFRMIRNLFLVLGLLASGMKAQLSGSYAIPGAYSTIAAAITDLNTLGVSGPVTFNVAGGFTETAPAGGYMVNAITGASSVNQIIFQKSGVGANPLITANTGTATPISAAQDGVWRFNGTDYVTVDGIDIIDPNTTNPATMEFGYGFFRASATDGCQNNTIKNCVITLKRVNNDAGAGPAVDGSRGIDVVDAASATHTTALTITSAAGANSNNKFYTNTIQNCNIGIALIGYADSSPFTNADTGNDIGGSSAATGNTIINFGGGGTTSPAAGVRTLAQYGVNVSYNTINNNNGSGVNHAAVLRGIYLNTATSANGSVNNNTITVKGGGTTTALNPIENTSGSTAAANTININNNVITNCSYATATSGVFNGILNSGTPANLNINNNTFSNNSSPSTGAYFNISNTGAIASLFNVNNNNINNISLTAAASGGAYRGISSTGASGTISINSNSMQAITWTGAPTGVISFILLTGTSAMINATQNTIINLTVPTTGNFFFMSNSNATPNTLFSNNFITGTLNKSGNGGICYGYYNFGSPTSGTATLTNNNFSNITIAGATGFYGVFHESDVPQNCILTTNTVSNISFGTGTAYGLDFSYGANANVISNNLVSNITGAGTIYGINQGATANTQLSVFGNTITGLSSTAAAGVYGYYQNTGTTSYIYKNKIYDLSGNNAGTTVSGIIINGGTTNGVFNNLIGDLRATTANNANAITAINVNAGTGTGVYFNTVYLNAVSSGAIFGTSAMYASTGPNVELRSNIFVNNSTPNGSGITAAYRRSSTTLSSYVSTSNNNLFYAGTQAANSVIFTDGTNNSINLIMYKSLMVSMDLQSVTENPNFLSTTGSNANYLKINTGIPTLIESGGIPYPGITDDFAGVVRNVSTPDIGAFEGPYVPFPVCSGAPPANTAMTTNSLVCTNGATNLFLNNNFPATGLTYQWMASTTGSTGVYAAITGGTLTTLTTTLGSISTWFQLVATCPSGPASSTTTPVLVTVGAPLTSSAVAASTLGCSGFNTSLSLSSAYSGVTYQWQSSTSSATGPFTSILNATLSTYAPSNITVATWYQAVIGCSATAAYTVATSPATVTLLAPPVYAAIPYLENFDNTWQDRCDTRNVPVTANWSSNPTTGNNSWRRQDDGGSAVWNSAATGINTPLTGAGCADFHSYFASGGTTGDLRLYVNLSTAPNYSVSFYYRNVSGTDSLQVLLSTNGGSTFSKIGGYKVNSSWSKKVINLGAINSNSCVISFSATSDFGNDDIGIDSLEIKTCPTVTAATTATSVCGATNVTLSATGTSGAITATRYTWSTGATTASTSLIPLTGNNIYTVTGSNGLCAVSKTVTVVAAAGPTVVFAGPTGICIGDVLTLTVSGAVSYSWATGETSTTYTAAPVVQTVYTVTGTDALGCKTIATRTVNSSAALAINVAGSSTVCLGSSVLLSASGANTYSWSTSALTTTIAPSPIVTTTYNVIGTSGTCSNSAVKVVTVNPNPVVAISGNSVICPAQSTTLTASGANTYAWSTGPLTTTIAVAPLNNITYSVTGTSTLGCSTVTTIAITVNTIVLSVARSSTAVCLNSSATFTGSGAVTYTWNTGPQVSIITVTPSSTGITTYTLSGTNAGGCSTSITTTINTFALPTIGIAPSSATVCSLANAAFLASGATTYTWNGNNALNTAAITFTPASNAVYTVVATNANGCVGSNTAAVTTNSLPIMTVVPTSTTVCAQSPVSYTVSGANSYFWNNNNNTTTSSTFFPSSNSVYTITGTTSQGCNSTITMSATALPLPVISVSPSFTTVCQGSTNTFTASGAVTYTWNGNIASTGSTIAIMTPSLSSYSIMGTGANGCNNSSQFVVVTNPLPTIGISASSSTVCSMQPVTLVASGALTFTWNGGVANDTTIVNPVNPTTYTVQGTDGLTGCVGSQTIAIATNSLPAITITPSSPTVCVKTPVTLTAGGGISYSWSNGSFQTNISLTPTANVSYTLTGTDALGCSNTTTVTVATNPLPTIIVTPPSLTVCAGETANYTASGASTYTWAVNTTISASLSITPTVGTFFNVSGTDVNGCKSTSTATIDVSPCTGIATNQLADDAVSVFPNPSTGLFTAKFEFEGEKTILITNSVGQAISESMTKDMSKDFDLNGMAKGIYFVRVSSKQASGNYKIVIN